MNKQMSLTVGSDQRWRTPVALYRELHEIFKFNFDPCPADPVVSGLDIHWKESNFVNPPYDNIGEWLWKGYVESMPPGGKSSVFLIPAWTDRSYFHDIAFRFGTVVFLEGRIQFNRKDGKTRCLFPSCLVIFDGGKIYEEAIGKAFGDVSAMRCGKHLPRG